MLPLTGPRGRVESVDCRDSLKALSMRYRRSIVAALLGWGALVGTAPAQQGDRNPGAIATPGEGCAGLADGAARIQCHQRALGQPATPGAAPQKPTDAWRLVRSRDPRGADAVSIMRTADTAV